MELKIIRVSMSKTATYGVLIYGEIPYTLTLEKPWLNNQRQVSCIPGGEYQCKRIHSPKFGNTFEVTNVPGRDAVLFHKGNISDHTHGCILLGEKFEWINGVPGIAESARGFTEFLKITEGISLFNLHIFQTYDLDRKEVIT